MTYGRFIGGHFTDESLVTDSAAGVTAGDRQRDRCSTTRIQRHAFFPHKDTASPSIAAAG